MDTLRDKNYLTLGLWLSSLEVMVTISDSFFSNKRVLITGHTGFKGAWLSLFRQYGATLYRISLPPSSPNDLYLVSSCSKLFANESFCDINDYSQLNSLVQSYKPDIIFHLAAQPLVIEGYLNPVRTWNTNLIGSLNLLESAKNLSDTCAVIMVTTDKVYKNNEWIYPYRETDPLGGHDPYSASKAACEIMIESWIKSFSQKYSHMRIGSVRAGNVIWWRLGYQSLDTRCV